MDWQIDKQTDRRIDRYIGWKARQIDETNNQIDRQKDKIMDMQKENYIDRQIARQLDR